MHADNASLKSLHVDVIASADGTSDVDGEPPLASPNTTLQPICWQAREFADV
jgi:hypothetical protein